MTPFRRPWGIDPRYVREDCYDAELLEIASPHMDEVVAARMAMLIHKPTAGMQVEQFPQLYVLLTQAFSVPTKDGVVEVPSLWIVYALIPEDCIIRPLHICKAAMRANRDLRNLAERALVHFHRANISS
jgi:hypothetical protein